MGERAKTGKCVSTYRRRNSYNWKIREHTSWVNRLKLENARAHLVGEITKTGKCGSTSRGRKSIFGGRLLVPQLSCYGAKSGKCGSKSRRRIDSNWKMREHISWAKQLKLENTGAHLVSEITKIGKCRSTSRG